MRQWIPPALAALAMLVTLAPATARGQEDPPQVREVNFASTAEGISIAGDLWVPSGLGPHAAVLMITGNGPHTRDQMISNSPMFRQIAEHFRSRGLAVMRTDSRGYGESTGPDNWELTTTEDRIRDNRAAYDFLAQQEEVDPGRIILFGHSEGAMIAAALAARHASPVLTVLLATSALPGGEVFSRQRSDSLRRRGADEATALAVHAQLLRFTEFLSGDRADRASFESIALDFLAAHGVAQQDLDQAFANSLLEGFLAAPWYWNFVGYDPGTDLGQVRGPVLAVFAGEDENVPWRRHLPALTDAMAGGTGRDLTTVVLPDQDHFFLEFEGNRVVQHQPGRMEVASELFDLLDAELRRRGLAR